MRRVSTAGPGFCAALLMVAAWGSVVSSEGARNMAKEPAGVPKFEYDVTWPKELPNNWILGMIGGLYVDPKTDHIWVANRFNTLTPLEKVSSKAAPPIIEFDQAGNVVQAWGGPGPGYEWPSREHGIAIDNQGNVWVGGNNNGGRADGSPPQRDEFIVKFTHDGKFIKQIGRAGQSKGSNDVDNFGLPAGIVYEPGANEIFVADGYKNRRVIVFDNTTGAYKRHWGAYGAKPDDSVEIRANLKVPPGDRPLTKQWTTVHCVAIAKDGLVYVCDRENDRIQVFHKDGTYVKEILVSPTIAGSVATDIAFSPDPAQRFMYVADHSMEKIYILRRDTMEVVGSFGHAGHNPGQFTVAHAIGVDSKGNIYVGESLEGKRVQRFKYVGMTK